MLIINRTHSDEIFDHARAGGAKEVCGILAGTGDRVKKIYRMANVSEKAADSYFMDPGEQLKVMKEIRNKGLEMIGIYHSHPASPAYPSARDVELAFYPEAVYLIVSLENKLAPAAKAFRITDGEIRSEEITVEQGDKK